MNIISHFISKFRDFLLVLLYLIISFLMMISSDNLFVEGLRSSTLGLFGFVNEQLESIDNYFSLSDINDQLRSENTRLAYENFQLQDALLENIRLRKLLQFKHNTDYQFIPAKVVGNSPQDISKGFLLSTEDHMLVNKNAAVMTADGLVGKIVKKSGKYSICQSLFDPTSRVSVRIQRNRELGIVAWSGANTLLLKNISNSIQVEEGDVIFTSGMSEIYPPNIKVGVISSVSINQDQLFQTIEVFPAVNFKRIEEVFILQAKSKDESGK